MIRLTIPLLSCLFLSDLNAQEQEQPPDFWRIVEDAIELRDVGAPAAEVLDHMAGIVERRPSVPFRIERVERALTQPWTPPALARELRDLLAGPAQVRKGPRFDGLWGPAAAFCDLELPQAEDDPQLAALDADLKRIEDPELIELELLGALSELVGHAHDALASTIEELLPDERRFIFGTHRDFREAWYRGHFPGVEQSAEHKTMVDEWVSLLGAARVDRAKALAVAMRLARLGDDDMRESLEARLETYKERAKADGFKGDVRAVVGDSPRNRVVLGGPRSTNYTGHAALVIDLGGDDHYERAAVVEDPDALVSVVIDLGGDDEYGGDPGPACAVGGVALLIDARGKDRYRCGRNGQAAATFGVALLLDLKGNDSYEMEDYGQGHAVAGTALLYDLDGDDDYKAWAFAQGGGLTYGLSALVDGDGNDTYLADLVWPDVYGNSGPEIYHGASQGYCTGIRSGSRVAGGVAALVDLGDGQDRYQSGNFSQGGAYYFSFALMYDDGGDDENFGTRYSQGFGVHQAAAVRWDAGGDDQYTCRSVAHGGMAWDEGVGYLLEDGGDDVYKLGGLALGGAAQTGVAVCIDLDGKDQYKSGGQSQGGNGGFEYHDKPSLGVLIDLGGDKDSYSEPDREDKALLVTELVGVFLDSKEKTLVKALKKLPKR